MSVTSWARSPVRVERVREEIFGLVSLLEEAFGRAERERRVEQVLERCTPPQGKRAFEQTGGALGLVAVQLAPRGGHELLERGDVERRAVELQLISRSGVLERPPVRRDDLAQARELRRE